MTLFIDKRILIFDENVFMGNLLQSIISAFGVGQLTVCRKWDEAKFYIKEIKYDCIFCDWSNWPDAELECLNYVRSSGQANDPTTPVIIISGNTALQNVLACRDMGCTEIVLKPISPVHVFDKLYAALFNPREFIVLENYTGPDRRRKKGNYAGFDRRSEVSLGQSDIDRLLGGEDVES